jgi:hypothetical protein
MNEERILDKISDCHEKDISNPEILDIEKQIIKLNDRIELMVPPDCYGEYSKITNKQEELRFKRDNLLFVKIYKEAFKDGLLTGLELDI